MNLLVLDKEYTYFRSVQTAVRNNLDGLNLWFFQSLDQLTLKYGQQLVEKVPEYKLPAELRGVIGASAGNSSAGSTVAMQAGKLMIRAHAETLDMVEISMPGQPADMINKVGVLGFEISKFDEPLFWKSLIDINDRDNFGRFLNSTKDRSAGTEFEFALRDAEGSRFKAKVRVRLVSENSRTDYLIEVEYEKDKNQEKKGRSVDDIGVVHGVLVSLELLGGNPLQTLQAIYQELVWFNSLFGAPEPVILVTCFDHPNHPIRQLLLTGQVPIADVLYKPFDELIFLQKIYMLIPNLKTQEQGSFLFTLESAIPFELGGEYQIVGFSETGIKVRHRVPIKLNNKLRMYFPGLARPLRRGAYGRCFRTEKQADGNLQSDFFLFGMNTEQLTTVREMISKMRLAKAKPMAGSKTQPAGAEVAISKDRRKVVVVDMDPRTVDTVSDLLRGWPQCDIKSFQSLYQFMKALDPSHQAQNMSLSSVQVVGQINWEVSPPFGEYDTAVMRFMPDSARLIGFGDPGGNTGVLCGFDRAELMVKSDSWMQVLHPDEVAMFKEYIQFLLSGQLFTKQFRFVTKTKTAHAIEIKPDLGGTLDNPEIVLTLTDVTATVARKGFNPNNTITTSTIEMNDLALLVLDMSFIRQDPDETLRSIAKMIRKASKLKNVQTLLLCKGEDLAKVIKEFDLPVLDVVEKPMDRGFFSRRLKQALILQESDQDLSVIDTLFPHSGYVDITRPVQAESLGEYGLDLVYPTPVSKGAWGYFYHPELLDEDGRGLLGRCVGSKNVGTNQFRSAFLFLAIKEDALKRLRLYLKKKVMSEASSM